MSNTCKCGYQRQTSLWMDKSLPWFCTDCKTVNNKQTGVIINENEQT